MRLNRLLFLFAALALGIAFCVEVGSGLLTVPEPTLQELEAVIREENRDLSPLQVREQAVDLQSARRESPPRPGLAIRYLAFLDGLLLFTVALIGLSLLLPERVHGRAQGVASLVVTVLLILTALVAVLSAVTLLAVMFGLFIATPFGTLAYVAIWGFFDRSGAAVTLSLLMGLKLAFVVLLVLSQPRFLQNKGLVLLIAFSLGSNVLIAFLHGLVPRVMVSLTDAVAAIVVGVFAIVWAVVMLVGALISIVKALQAGKGKQEDEGRTPVASGSR